MRRCVSRRLDRADYQQIGQRHAFNTLRHSGLRDRRRGAWFAGLSAIELSVLLTPCPACLGRDCDQPSSLFLVLRYLARGLYARRAEQLNSRHSSALSACFWGRTC